MATSNRLPAGRTSLVTMTDRHAIRSQRGAAMIETIVALPVLWLMIGGAIELGLLFQAKATLNHATLQAARAGMVNNASPPALQEGLVRGLLPLYSPPSSPTGVLQTLASEVLPDVQAHSRIRILNPTQEAFVDFGVIEDGQLELPNDELHRAPTTTGTLSNVNVQDANLLRVEVVYGAPLRVPFVAELITATLSLTNASQFDAFEQGLLAAGRLPILATATVRMQSPARPNSFMVSRGDQPLALRRVRPGDPPPP